MKAQTYAVLKWHGSHWSLALFGHPPECEQTVMLAASDGFARNTPLVMVKLRAVELIRERFGVSLSAWRVALASDVECTADSYCMCPVHRMSWFGDAS